MRSARDQKTGAPWLSLVNNDAFFSPVGYKGFIESILTYEGTQILVAADPADESHAFGFVVFEQPSILHYVYTKAPFRNLEVATRLLQAALPGFGREELVTTSSCRVWGKLDSWNDISRRYGFVFNPFIRATAGQRKAF